MPFWTLGSIRQCLHNSQYGLEPFKNLTVAELVKKSPSLVPSTSFGVTLRFVPCKIGGSHSSVAEQWGPPEGYALPTVKTCQRCENSHCHHLWGQANSFSWTRVTTYQSIRSDIPEDLELYLLASSRGSTRQPYSHSNECTPYPLTLCLLFFPSCGNVCVCVCVCVWRQGCHDCAT
jgi:hypothetical protein